MDQKDPVLEYGRSDSSESLMPGRPMRYALLILLVGPFIFWWSWQLFYYHDRDAFRSTLQEIPGVRIRSLDGFDDGPGWKVVGASVSVDGVPQSVLYLMAGNGSDLSEGRHLLVRQLGPYRFDVMRPDGSRPEWIDLGRDGEFANLLPFQLQSARDLAEHYSAILRILDKVPRSGTHVGRDGMTYQFRLMDASGK
jgi:hypothetical protein